MNCPMSGKPCNKYKGFYVTEKNGEKVTNYQVCEDCLYINASKNAEIASEEKKCKTCGKTLGEIVKESRMGCADCYCEFDSAMEYIIAAVQNSNTRHVGRSPYTWRKQQAENTNPVSFATELSQRMKIAKREENYRLAAKIKVHLDEFNKKLSEYHESNEERAPVLRQELAEFIFNYRESELPESV